MSAQAKSSRDPVSGLRAIGENLECLAIAIVMALVLKFFLLEAYKIPTGSMQPTIMGTNEPELRVFDRVLVNKMIYFLRSPRRFEVVVFKMPLSQRQNYIKRLIGLAGEKIRIRNGDIFITPPGESLEAEEIARKPDRVWRSVRKRLIPADPDESRLKDALRAEHGEDASVELRDDSFTLKPVRGRAWVVTDQDVRDAVYDGYDTELIPPSARRRRVRADHPVSDVELSMEVTPTSDVEKIHLELRGSRFVHIASFDVGGGDARIRSFARRSSRSDEREEEAFDETRRDLEGAGLPAHETTDLSFRNVDDELVLRVDGDEVARLPYRTEGHDDHSRSVTVAVGCEGGGQVDVEEYRLYRDIHYVNGRESRPPDEPYEVPEDAFFVMGDNTQHSYDCRQWELGVYDLPDDKKVGGLVLQRTDTSSPDANPRVIMGDDGRQRMQLRNIYGELYDFPKERRQRVRKEGYHYVPEEFLLGKAVAVFWPLPPFSPTWRLKLVR